jgi:putative addiction module component (TIGR02574 family)
VPEQPVPRKAHKAAPAAGSTPMLDARPASWHFTRMMKQLTPHELSLLPVAERLQLIEDLWEALDAEIPGLPLADWQTAELDRRLTALDSGESVGSSWPDVRRRITGRP